MKKFEAPEFEVTRLFILDVITTSGDDWDDWEGDTGDNDTPWN